MFQTDIPLSEEVSPAYICHLDSLLKKFFATSMMGDCYVKMAVVGGRFCSDSTLIGHLQSHFKCSVNEFDYRTTISKGAAAMYWYKILADLESPIRFFSQVFWIPL